MAKKTVWICDRCGNERVNLSTSTKWINIHVGPQNDGRPTKDKMLLCTDCKDDFYNTFLQ